MPALQELDAEGSLETRHPTADRGLGNAQFLGGPSQTSGARDDHEQLEIGQVRHQVSHALSV